MGLASHLAPIAEVLPSSIEVPCAGGDRVVARDFRFFGASVVPATAANGARCFGFVARCRLMESRKLARDPKPDMMSTWRPALGLNRRGLNAGQTGLSESRRDSLGDHE